MRLEQRVGSTGFLLRRGRMSAGQCTRRTQKKRLGAYRRRNRKLSDGGLLSYADYLASDDWQTLRQRVLERDDFICVACGAQARCVHHTNYTQKTLSSKFPTLSLVSLCHRCHGHIEFLPDGTKSTPKEAAKRLRELCRKFGRILIGRCQNCLYNTPPKGNLICRACRACRKAHLRKEAATATIKN